MSNNKKRKIAGFYYYSFLKYNSRIRFNSIRMFIYRKIFKMHIGNNTMIWLGNRFYNVRNLNIGHNSIIGPENTILADGGILIGNNVNISGFSYITSQSHDVNDPMYGTVLSKVIIEDYVWIAPGCTILPGVRLGKGAVIGAGSVVTKNVEPFTIVAGNPAKKVGDRNNNIKYKLNSMKGIKWI